MRRWPAAAVAALLVGLIATPGFGATNADQRVVREAVVTTAAPDGSPLSTLVSQLVQLSSKDGSNVTLNMPKVADLQSYRNLSGFSGPSGDSKNVSWHTTGSLEANALAKINRKLPFEVHVHYFLNGKEVQAKQVDGKDGRLKISVELVNASGDPKTLEYNGLTSPYLSGTVEEYIPFEYAVRIVFPQGQWSGVTGKRFDVAPSGTDQIAAATGVLSPPLTQVSDTIDVSAHSSDMLRPHIEVFAFPKINPNLLGSLQTQYEALRALYGGTGDISSNLVKLYQGTLQLVDGLTQFAGGTGQLDSGISKIVAGVGTRDPKTGKANITLDKNGTPTTVIGGIGAIEDGLKTALLPAVGTRDPKTGKANDATASATTLIGGIGYIESVLLDKLLPAVGTRDPVTGKGVITLDSLGNSTTLLGGLQSQKNAYDTGLIPGAEQLTCGLDNTAFPNKFCKKQFGITQSITSGVTSIQIGVGLLISQLQTNSASTPGFREGLLGIQSGLGQAVAGLQSGNPAAPGLQEGLLGVTNGLAQVLAGLAAYSSIPGVATSLQTVSTGLSDIASSLDGTNVRQGLEGVVTGLGGMLTDVTNVTAKVTDANDQATTALTVLGLPLAVTDALTAIQGDAASALTTLTGMTAALTAAKSAVQTALDTLSNDPTDVIPTIQSLNTVVGGLITTLNSVPSGAALSAGVQQAKGGIDAMLGAVGRLVRTATTVALPANTLAANALTGNANGQLPNVGGTALAAGDRVLVKNEAAAEKNGIYKVTQTGSASTPFVLTRDTDADSSAEVTHGMGVSITGGSLANQTWVLSTAPPITLDTTPLTFVVSSTPTFLGGAKQMLAGVGSLITALGNSADPSNQSTIIGVLKSIHDGTGQLLPGIAQLSGGAHNQAWDKPQKEIKGLINTLTTPHQLYSVCPGCFDKTFTNYDHTKGILLPNGKYVKPGVLAVLRSDPRFSPGVLEVFHLFSDGIKASLPKLVSFDPKNPGLVDALGLIAAGLDKIVKGVSSLDGKNPGLVEGINQVVGGLQTLQEHLQTFDPNNPGLVDGLQLVQGGIGQLDSGAGKLHSGGQQISQGLFAIDQLGLRVVHGQVGDTGDKVAQDKATLTDALDKLGGSSTLAKADAASTTYVFEIPAASTATRDNLIRGGLISLLLALLVMMARRPSLLGA